MGSLGIIIYMCLRVNKHVEMNTTDQEGEGILEDKLTSYQAGQFTWSTDTSCNTKVKLFLPEQT